MQVDAKTRVENKKPRQNAALHVGQKPTPQKGLAKNQCFLQKTVRAEFRANCKKHAVGVFPRPPDQ